MFHKIGFLMLFLMLFKPGLKSVQKEFGARQLIVVTNKSLKSAKAILRFYEWQNQQWQLKKGPFDVVLGVNGLAYADNLLPAENFPTAKKTEGDGCSPAGLFALTGLYGYSDATFKMDYLKVNDHTFCVDDASSKYYGKIVSTDTVKKDWKSAETMRLKNSNQYKFGIFVAYNTTQVKPAKGSCIFMHIWGKNQTPTSGCTAMTENNLLQIMGLLNPAKKPMLLQVTQNDYKQLKNKYMLP